MTTRIKICGLRDAATARQAARLGADAIGLVFYGPSPRNVDLATAAAVCAALPPFVSSVGLFVNAEPAFVRQVLAAVPLDVLQFHGDEAPDYCRAFGRPYLKAVRVKPDVNLLEYAARYADARGLLVDAFVEGVPGGTGEAFDWRLLPPDLPLPLVLSGGLDPDNVRDAVQRVRPWAVDVSSGVESARGVKDLERIAAFIDAVRAA
ncbi:N-(5'-phosphoribosyl)anthranilate isomerase [Chitiniphilus shinanonensis]|uniref:N-(5'-phosphoribosyl)anthranilate isomerase n=1 Tax=Chitiniphilus shinanonensis TaxID=553088 RepID=A0ABQ6BN70_9NEIS|nr:phosphoribosylanthranilate isomerase [Chitiniphilus shinanonensis]GLS03368.1 N-(5'-phosphoribosyl)anthranilate isomerase [Chitiniphilus shinanonensis]